MAFPVTSVLDNFNAGANQLLTARSGWAADVGWPTGTGVTGFTTDATPTKATNGPSGSGNAWGASFVDMEAYMTLSTFVGSSDNLRLAARIQTGAPSYYAVDMAASASTNFQIIKVISGSRTAIGTLQAVTFSASDSVGITVIGNQITSWYKVGAGAWTQKDTVSDSSITGPGLIGFGHFFAVSTTSIDDFGGGNLVVSASQPSATFQRRSAGPVFA